MNPLQDLSAIDKWNWIDCKEEKSRGTISTVISSTHERSSSRHTSSYGYNLKELPSAKKKWSVISSKNSFYNIHDDESDNSPHSATSLKNPEGRCSHSICNIDEHTLIMCGGGRVFSKSTTIAPTPSSDEMEEKMTEQKYDHFNDLHIFSAINSKWSRVRVLVNNAPMESKGDMSLSTGKLSYWGQSFIPRRGHSAAYDLPSQRLIVFGGITNASYCNDGVVDDKPVEDYRCLSDLWIFSMLRSQWRQLHIPNPPSPRRGATAWIDNDYFHIFGGLIPTLERNHGNHEGALFDQNIYRVGPLSVSENEWKWSILRCANGSFLLRRDENLPTVEIPPKPFSLAFAAASIIGRKLWVFGGLHFMTMGRQLISDLFYVLDLDKLEWNVLQVFKNAPCSRYCHSMVSIGKYLVVSGGIGLVGLESFVQNDTADSSSDAFLRHQTIFDLFVFDTEICRWRQEMETDVEGEWPGPRNGFTMSCLGCSKILLFGGGVYPNQYYDTTHVLDFILPMKIFKPVITENTPNDLSADLSTLLSSTLLSDIILVSGSPPNTKRYPVHKAILAARCPYFRIMLTGPYTESTSEEILLPDVDSSALELLLEYVYAGWVDLPPPIPPPSNSGPMKKNSYQIETDEVVPQIVSSLLHLTDLWDMTRLHGFIEDYLADIVLKNLLDPIEVVSFAKVHNCKKLRMLGLKLSRRRWGKQKDDWDGRLNDEKSEVIMEIKDFFDCLL